MPRFSQNPSLFGGELYGSRLRLQFWNGSFLKTIAVDRGAAFQERSVRAEGYSNDPQLPLRVRFSTPEALDFITYHVKTLSSTYLGGFLFQNWVFGVSEAAAHSHYDSLIQFLEP